MITPEQIRDTERVFKIAKDKYHMNAYETVLALSMRAREIQQGATPTVKPYHHKAGTIAIREVLE